MSWLYVALLALAVVAAVGAEWPRLGAKVGTPARRKRSRAKRKANLRVLRSDSEDFAASVQRDLSQLPTTEERDARRR